MAAGYQQLPFLAGELDQAGRRVLPEQCPGPQVVQDDDDRQHMAEPVVPVTSGVPEPPAVLRLFREERGAGLDLQRKQLTRRLLRAVKRLHMRVDAVILDRLLPEQPAPCLEHQGCRTHAHPASPRRGGCRLDAHTRTSLLRRICLRSSVCAGVRLRHPNCFLACGNTSDGPGWGSVAPPVVTFVSRARCSLPGRKHHHDRPIAGPVLPDQVQHPRERHSPPLTDGQDKRALSADSETPPRVTG